MSKTLREQLLPGDEVVHFVNSSRLEPEAASRNDALVQAVEVADEVLLVRVAEVKTELIYDGHWARTLIKGDVRSVFKAPAGTVRRGDKRTFEIGGGQVVLDGVTVRILEGVPYKKGHLYLAFLGKAELMSGVDLSPHFGAMPLVKHGDVFLAYPGFSEHLSGITLEDVRRAIAHSLDVGKKP